MTPERWQQIKRLFHESLAHEPAQRSAFLAKVCGEDVSLRQEIEALLASHEQSEDFMETPASDIAASLLAEEHSGLAPGEMVGPFTITNALATGGMGQVYLAEDTRLSRSVALKLLPTQFTVDRDRVRRFEQEARAASALNHPNIVTIHEIGQTDSLHYIATEFVDGETLREHMTVTRMTVGEVLEVSCQVASALQAAHEAGIVHRDIKPENIMLRRDRIVKVLDFGLAKLAPIDQQTTIKSTVTTNPGVVMGTVAYMSPEQARGNEVDARTDIWSLGVVLYEMVTRRAPFKGDTASHVIVSILENKPTSLSVDTGVPAELVRIISKSLCKDPGERYQSAREMALDLKNLKEELTIETRLKKLQGSPDRDEKIEAPAAFATAEASSVRTSELSGPHSLTSAEYLLNGIKRHRGSAVFASMAGLLLIASLVYFSNITIGGSKAIDSMAVLHFVNEGGDPDAEYLAAGLSESLINSLSRLPKLRVKSLNAVSRYKGQHVDASTLGRELNVRAVLFVRISQRKDAMEISTELVDVRDNSRLWGEQYKRKASDLLELQKEIVGEIAEKLSLDSAEKQRLTRQYTTNKEAHDAYSRGRFLLEKAGGHASDKIVEYLERAINLDPNYAPAYAILGFAYWSLGKSGARPLEEALRTAKRAAAKALELDQTLSDAYVVLGHVASTERHWTAAERAFKRAVELNPNSAFAHSNYAFYLLAMKRLDEAVAASRRAVELEPTSAIFNRNAALNLYFARRYDEAIEQSLKTLELNPNMSTAADWLACAYEQKGMYDQAIEVFFKFGFFSNLGPEAEATLKTTYTNSGWKSFLQKLLSLKQEQIRRTNVDRPLFLAEIYARLGEKDKAFANLERASANPSFSMTTLNADPLWDNLRSDPRYADLVRRIGLEP